MSTTDTHPERPRQPDAGLGEAIAALENVEWHHVPGVSPLTAATFQQQLRWSRAAVQGEADVRWRR